MSDPKAIELSDIPECDPNVSRARILSAGSTAVVVYESKDAGWPDTRTWAAVRFDRCWPFLGGGPNDEAFHNHPFYKYGLKHYTLQELVGSPWIEERGRIADNRGDPKLFMARKRHFVFALKDFAFECLASGYQLIGNYSSLDAAMQAGFEVVHTGRSATEG